MREGRQLVRASSQFASEQRGRSWWNLLPTVGAFIGLIWVLCMDWSWAIRIPACVLLALVHTRMFVI